MGLTAYDTCFSVFQSNHMEKVGQPVFLIELKTEVFEHLCILHGCLSDDVCAARRPYLVIVNFNIGSLLMAMYRNVLCEPRRNFVFLIGVV